jgi:hypothetical protein
VLVVHQAHEIGAMPMTLAGVVINYFGTRQRDRYGLFWDHEASPGEIDAKFPPRTNDGHDEAAQGLARTVLWRGWTIVAFWDRSGDPRGRCNSAFAVRGIFSFDAVMATAREAYPWVFERLAKAGVTVVSE